VYKCQVPARGQVFRHNTASAQQVFIIISLLNKLGALQCPPHIWKEFAVDTDISPPSSPLQVLTCIY